MAAPCAHETTMVMHNPGTVAESQVHVLIGTTCWCRPATYCGDCNTAGVPMSEQRAHIYPVWAAAPEAAEASTDYIAEPPPGPMH